jgi:hypothetical protein
MTRRNFVLALSVVMTGAMLAGTVPVGAAPPAPITGTIVSATADAIVLNTSQGHKTFKTSPTTTVITRSVAKLSDITKGEWVGVDAKKGANGALTAVSINIFPPNYKGRTGQWMMDSGDTMTNAEVSTVQSVSQVSGHVITLTYQGGVAKIGVPSSAMIHRNAIIPLSALKSGMHVMVRGRSGTDGTWTASSIVVDSMTAMH